ncbi:MAG: hypothetical protein ACREC9_13975 [Methylocella sp.]
MKKRIFHAIALLLAVAASSSVLGQSWKERTSLVAAANAASQAGEAPAVGDSVSTANFAWWLFVQVMKPDNGSPLFESWTEQTCLIQPGSCPPAAAAGETARKLRHLHQSPLLRKNAGAKTAAALAQGQCSPGAPMNAPSAETTPVFNGFFPANLSSNPCFYEEVYVNPAELKFLTKNGLTTLTGQQAYGNQHSNAITFPKEAVEVKVDWVPASSFTNATFTCPDQTHQLYTENINGTCYALVGLHVTSKVLKDWVWATFEPNSAITNPNRCDPALYVACYDPWGTNSRQPYGPGQSVAQSPQLRERMKSAKLDPAFNNYFLTGVQTQFVDRDGTALPLGSSFVEFNAQVAPGQASCITCHKYAYFNGQNSQPQQNFGGPLAPPNFPTNWPSIGFACYSNPNENCLPPANTSGWTSQDFSWMLGLMPYK